MVDDNEHDEQSLLESLDFNEFDPNLRFTQDAMPKLELEQNSRVYLRINPLSHQHPPLQAEFLGAGHYEFIILRLPVVPGLLKQLLPQTRTEIRYMQEGAVHAFTTEIISYSTKPSLVLFTTYPDRMSIRNTRRHHRILCALPIIMHSAKGDGEGIISDLSLGGCRVVFELTGQAGVREIEVGSELVLQMAIRADGLPCGAKAVVRNVELAGVRMAVGLSFVDAHRDFTSQLAQYIRTVKFLE